MPGRVYEFVFDDGGMNLLSSPALRRIREALPDVGEPPSEWTAGPAAETAAVHSDPVHARPSGPSLFLFRSGRPNLFAAGADMAEMQRFTPLEAREFARLGQELFDAIERLPCITVVLIDGDCFGGALDLILAFDLRFATPRSRFAHPGARLGIVTGFGGTSRWRKTLTRRAASQLFLANRVLSAESALALGLVDRVAESHEDELARLRTIDARFVKELTMRSERLSRRDLVVLAGALFRLAAADRRHSWSV